MACWRNLFYSYRWMIRLQQESELIAIIQGNSISYIDRFHLCINIKTTTTTDQIRTSTGAVAWSAHAMQHLYNTITMYV